MNTLAKHQALTHYTEQARIATLEQQRDELSHLLEKAAEMLRHSACKAGIATQCPACSLESQIGAALARIKA